jgi:hypothetical protein
MWIFRREFDRSLPCSSFPAKIAATASRCLGSVHHMPHQPDRLPSGRRVRPLLWSESEKSAGFRDVRTMVPVIIVLILGFADPSVASAARRSSIDRMAFGQWNSLIAEASQRFGVPVHWIRAVMQVESRGDKGAVSPKGAMGLMQVMPETYAELRLRHHLGEDPFAPRDNIMAGAAYLREMRDRFGPSGFLAAYNAGPGRYEEYLKRGRPLPEETRNYVAALAPIIGVPVLPHEPTSAALASQMATSRTDHITRTLSRTSIKSRFGSDISQFDDRRSAKSVTLFAIIETAFEPASGNARAFDRTALEPTQGRALNAKSSAAERFRPRTSKAPRASFIPSADALFVVRSTDLDD